MCDACFVLSLKMVFYDFFFTMDRKENNVFVVQINIRNVDAVLFSHQCMFLTIAWPEKYGIFCPRCIWIVVNFKYNLTFWTKFV